MIFLAIGIELRHRMNNTWHTWLLYIIIS
jgi:hypothetical protein